MSAAGFVEGVTRLFRSLQREVWIVTAATNEQRGGCTVTWLSPASIDSERPVVLIGIAPNHWTAEMIDGSGAFAAHLLRADQADLAWRFASCSSRSTDKFLGLEVRAGLTGAPLIADCAQWLEARVFERFAMGDRVYYWADVVACGSGDGLGESQPVLTDHLLFSALTADQRAVLIDQLGNDVALQRPAQAAWRANR